MIIIYTLYVFFSIFIYFDHKSLTLVRYSTPGNILPSNNSNEAPPPVET